MLKNWSMINQINKYRSGKQIDHYRYDQSLVNSNTAKADDHRLGAVSRGVQVCSKKKFLLFISLMVTSDASDDRAEGFLIIFWLLS
ncbi:hypothetical protein JTE90_020671 [Oedothorax gibbosus]|uniref:Uncharacterized protein n=1 Tax=Oedothorax gibbosus TaxID=931172 RepID=A0AAV6UU10_9ARAC|nr:hypothetical protein JTE90_020671 [Oedothorax gibbosus]